MSVMAPFWAAIDRSWRVGNEPTAGALTGRCEIFGPHDQGPRHLQGGRWGPQYNGRIVWHCRNPQEMRVRIHCRYAHARGECAGHCGGITIPVCRPHFAMFHKRMNKACTKCAQPPEQISLEEAYYDAGWQYQRACEARDYEAVERLASRVADIEAAMAELITRGIVRRAEMFMTEVS
jgi:hypothetical protein